jgi:hypothetical protein
LNQISGEKASQFDGQPTVGIALISTPQLKFRCCKKKTCPFVGRHKFCQALDTGL